MPLEGLSAETLLIVGPDLGSPSYSQLVADTLGDTATDTDALALDAIALSEFIDEWDAEVRGAWDTDAIDDVTDHEFDLGIDDAMLAQLAVADIEEATVNAGLDFLIGNFAVWGLLTDAINFVLDEIGGAVSYILGVIAGLNSSGPGLGFGGL